MIDASFLPELKIRWQTIQAALRKNGADAILITTNVNAFYVSGHVFKGFAYIPASGDPLFFVRRPVGVQGDMVVHIQRPADIPAYFHAHEIAVPKILMLESDAISYTEYTQYQSLFGTPETLNGSALMRGVRSIKSSFEIDQLRISGQKHAQTYRQIPSVYRPGMTDTDLSIEIERLLRLNGSLGLFRIAGSSMEIFMGSLIAGENADNPSPYDFAMGGSGLNPSLPVGSNGTPLTEGISIMVDMGGNFTGYMTDMTRVFSVGRLTDRAYRAHQTALDIQRAITEAAQPGTPVADFYHMAVEMAQKAGLSDYFMGHRQKAGFIGHGVGIEINEAPVVAPRSKETLEKGMVIALEPKFVLPGIGAVGIENTFVVTDKGLEKITVLEEGIIDLA